MDDNGPGMLEYMAGMLAPNVTGCRAAKEAVMLALVGGRRGNDTYRHDINLLLVDGVNGVRDELCAAAAETVPLGLHASVPGASVGGELYLDGLRGMSAGERCRVFHLLDTRTVSVGARGMSYEVEARGPLLAVAHGGGGWDGVRSLVRGTNVGERLLTRFDLVCVLDGGVAPGGRGGQLREAEAAHVRAARRLKPGISGAGQKAIREWYVEARKRRNVRVNPRHAATAARLAFAHAKLCMSGEVGEDHARKVIEMVESMAPVLTSNRPPRVVLGTGAH